MVFDVPIMNLSVIQETSILLDSEEENSDCSSCEVEIKTNETDNEGDQSPFKLLHNDVTPLNNDNMYDSPPPKQVDTLKPSGD